MPVFNVDVTTSPEWRRNREAVMTITGGARVPPATVGVDGAPTTHYRIEIRTDGRTTAVADQHVIGLGDEWSRYGCECIASVVAESGRVPELFQPRTRPGSTQAEMVPDAAVIVLSALAASRYVVDLADGWHRWRYHRGGVVHDKVTPVDGGELLDQLSDDGRVGVALWPFGCPQDVVVVNGPDYMLGVFDDVYHELLPVERRWLAPAIYRAGYTNVPVMARMWNCNRSTIYADLAAAGVQPRRDDTGEIRHSAIAALTSRARPRWHGQL